MSDEAEKWNPVHPDQIHDGDSELWEVIGLFRDVDWMDYDEVMRWKKQLEDVRQLLDDLAG